MGGQNNKITLTSPTTLEWLGKTYPCQSGRGGICRQKVEGDGATPAGTFPLRQVFYRPDHFSSFPVGLPLTPLNPVDGWCDDPDDPLYNHFVTLPYPGRHEILWRPDHVYDIVIVVGYNDSPVIPHKGSAIFIHLINDQKGPTEGCISLYQSDLLEIMRDINLETRLFIPATLDVSAVSIP